MNAPRPAVRTVLGDIAPGRLGLCDAHDHLFLRSPLLPGQELDDEAAAEAELRAFAAVGGGAVAQWTPLGLGRRMDLLPRLSAATGVHLIAATGLHQAAHYAPGRLRRLLPGLAERFVADLTGGAAGAGEAGPAGGAPPVRAGMIKVAGSFHVLDAHARFVFSAAAEAHHATGAPIGVHLEGGTAALAVLDALCGGHGVPPGSVILGHLNRAPDSATHRRAAEAGAYLAFDGPSRAHHATDWRLPECLRALVEAGCAERVLIGGDTTTAAARAATGGGPGMPHLPAGLREGIERELGAEAVELFYRRNPARAFAASWRA
ncbi:phosphotriesterase [Streptomyces hoynatensis]|uniref:Phosphotriesterase n=1 Tax=Streptomyces hoynatensis TaxID=1141874 RepID=A0A3A9Z9H4_9ACTN|nr:phosphotriesterase [Streptomyces hoynatensis]RKN44960.1 phosphotriesterase [Streptomyces hoynatensis]